MCKKRHTILVIAMIGQLCWATQALADGAAWVRIQPKETDEILANPGMGWETFHRTADNDSNLPSWIPTCAERTDASEADQAGRNNQTGHEVAEYLRTTHCEVKMRGGASGIRNEYVPKLAEIMEKQQRVFTEEQMRARREAFRAAREAGKEGRELQEAARAAIKLTEEQQKHFNSRMAERKRAQLRA